MSIGLSFSASSVEATGFSPNVREGSDIVMKDRRWPAWDQGTYHCFWYMSFIPQHPRLGNFYGGIATKGPDAAPGMFMSYWGEVKTIHQGPYFYSHGYGAEGASGGAHGKAIFLRPGGWYRFVMRIYPPAKDAAQKTCVGWWVKDIEKNQWHTHSVVVLPAHATGFRGNSGFVEALAPDSVHRAFERRLGYCRAGGKWHKSNVVTTNSPQFFKLIEQGTVLRYDRSEPDSPGGVKTDFVTQQPDEPPLDPPAIEDAEARSFGNQVMVRWNIPQNASPQLGYTIEVFADRAATGTPLRVFEDTAPQILATRLDTPREAQSVRLTVTDIFDQHTSVTIPVQPTALDSAAEAAGIRPGLAYTYYEPPDNTEWERLPDFSALTPVRQGHVATLDDTVRQDREKLYAMRYAGYLRAPADGLYVLSAGTCDGSRMKINGRVIAENDGIRSASVKQYTIALRQGLHAFELLYFKGPSRRHHANIANRISIGWEGPGFGLRKLAEDDFVCGTEDVPSLTLALQGDVSGGILKDNLAKVRAKITRHGHRPTKLQLYNDRMLLSSAAGDELAVASGGKKGTGPICAKHPPGRSGKLDLSPFSEIVFQVLLPAGKNRLWARLWCDDNRSVDSSNVLDVETQECAEGPWRFIVLGHKHPIGARYKDGRASFTGEGFYVAYQKVLGDFTLTARIADITLAIEENGIHGSNWLGLYTSNVKRPRQGNGLESTFDQWGFGIYLTAGVGMKGSADFPDLAGTRMGIPSFPADHRWLRIVRRGQRKLAFTSADGKTWIKAMDRISRRYTDEQYVGVSFRAIPGKGRGLFQGAFDHMTLELGKVPEEVRERPNSADLDLDHRITAVVQARKDPDILFARSPTEGLLRSADRGETWSRVNQGLDSPDALAVRSVAVHPENSSIVLRAGGAVVDGTLASGLWRSTDGGKYWKLITREIDFDGRGPTTLFGDVVAFCLEDPDLVAAGGETKGLFVSNDAGKTWKQVGLGGERITCLAFVPDTQILQVGTFADREFETLGLGKPFSPVETPGRIYRTELAAGKAPRFSPSCEVPDFGVTNIGFGAHTNFATFATTRGVFYTWQRDNMFCQRRHEIPADTLFTALGYRQFMKETRPNEWRLKSTTYAAPFSGTEKCPVYCAPERTTGKWSLVSHDAKVDGPGTAIALNSGVSCILPDKEDENTLYLCNRHGMFKSVDGGQRYERVFKCSPSPEGHSR